EDAIRDGADALVGKEVVLRTRTGSRKGKVESVTVDGITMVARIKIDGRAVGKTRATVKWSALAPAEQDRLATSWKPEGSDGAVARVIVAQPGKDKAGAARALAAAGEHPLGKYLSKTSAPVADEAAERAARSAWSRIKRVRLSSTARARKLLKEIADFEEKYGQTRCVSTAKDRLGALKRYASLVSTLPRGAAHFGGHWYAAYEQRTTWHEAKRFCEERDGHLVTITSKEENNFVKALTRTMTDNGWIGLSDVRLEGKWEWVTGERVSFSAWGRGEPNNYHGEEDFAALAFARSLKVTGTWNDWSESRRKFCFICEWEK
ncbi:MAG: lectin-like protein, partial [Planctomycetota bacterium]